MYESLTRLGLKFVRPKQRHQLWFGIRRCQADAVGGPTASEDLGFSEEALFAQICESFDIELNTQIPKTSGAVGPPTASVWLRQLLNQN